MPIILPNTGKSTTLPVQILDPNTLSYSDEELLIAMSEYDPNTKFKPGDLASLVDVPYYLRAKDRLIPRVWQVRFVISTWQHEIMRLAQSTPVSGIDHVHALLEQYGGLRESTRSKPLVYAHAFPHGLYPDSAAWFPERMLQRITLHDHNQNWTVILDAAKAPFQGYDTEGLLVPYTFDLAPDLYSDGEALGKPFGFEEATTHTAALLGMEESLFRPVPHQRIRSR